MSQVCNDFLNGRCYRTSCRFSHEGGGGGGAPPPASGYGAPYGGGYGGGYGGSGCAAGSVKRP